VTRLGLGYFRALARTAVGAVASFSFAPSACESHELQRLQTRVPVLADNEMVVHSDAERARNLDDRLCHVDVGARGRRIAGGMIVHHIAI
jgi:hypothetical protein